MSQIDTNLNNPFDLGKGVTPHFKITYDSSMSTANGQDRANGLLAKVEDDYNDMAAWFPGLSLPFSLPISLQIVTGSYAGAKWGPPIQLQPGDGQPVELLRYLVVSEVTEMFMKSKANGWGYSFGDSNEGSKGEALSRYLGFKFLQQNSLSTSILTVGGSTFFVSNSWLGSTRQDFVNNNPDDIQPDATTGCTTLFLYYLISQLKFDLLTVINNGADTMAHVFTKLTGDTGDPFPFFSRLVGNAFPGTSQITAGPNFDDPFPVGILSIWADKSTFGVDEVTDIINTQGGLVTSAFFLVLEGFSINSYNSWNISFPKFTGSLLSFLGISITPTPATPGGPVPSSPIAQFEDPTNSKAPQRIRFSFDITFSNTTAFPSVGSSPVFGELNASARAGSQNILGATASTVFEFLAGADPYFTNVDPNNAGSVFYLSQDVRVFPVTAGTSVLGSPAFTTDPYASIQKFIGHMNGTTKYTTPSANDPLSGLPGQTGFETGDTSVYALNSSGTQTYNFAIARVRLRGSANSKAEDVRVFFRLWVAPSFDTDYQPLRTYPSTLGTSGADVNRPIAPLASGTGITDPSGQLIQTIPFFATDSNGTHDYDKSVTNNNVQTITIPDKENGVWAYFGCYLDVFNAQNQAKFGGTHHCVVAQIAYSPAPIPTSTPAGKPISPANWDQLGQRNLQITTSENPKSPATHVVPQAFDMRSSKVIAPVTSPIHGLPDEFMIDWGNTPAGSTATFYWPQVNAMDVVALASQIYSSHLLNAVDDHTLQCTTTKGITYVPIPFVKRGSTNFAGLFTVTLPTTIKDGQKFNILVRRVSSNVQLHIEDPPEIPRIKVKTEEQGAIEEKSISLKARSNQVDTLPVDTRPVPTPTRPIFESRLNFTRQILGSFQVNIPVTNRTVMLAPEVSTLAALKWRLQEMDPIYRWYPIIKQYISLVSARVDGLGGSSGQVPPVLGGGLNLHPHGPHHCHHRHHWHDGCVGKIVGLCYNHQGVFEGFLLEDMGRKEREVVAHEKKVEELVKLAWENEWSVEVKLEKQHLHGHRGEHMQAIIIRKCN